MYDEKKEEDELVNSNPKNNSSVDKNENLALFLIIQALNLMIQNQRCPR